MKDFILPDIGEGIVECEIVEWLIAEGDHIEEDQPVADVMTDKALVQIPAMHSGTVKKLYYQKGDIAKVHEPLFGMDIDGETPSTDGEEKSTDTASAQTTVSPAVGDKVIEDFILPDIGEGIVECELVEWLVEEGEVIEEDQPVADVMTDKALVQIPAKHAGRVTKLHYAKGEIAKVHTPLFAIEIDAHEGHAPVAAINQQQDSAAVPGLASGAVSGDKFPGGEFEAPVVIDGKVLASPAVRRLAREYNLDLSTVVGSGKKGRVLKADVLNAIGQDAKGTQGTAGHTQTVSSVAPVSSQGSRTVPIRGVQAAMAKQMAASVYTIPHFSVSDEVNMDNLIALRKQLKPEFEKQGLKLSFMPFIIKAMSLALKQFPIINAQVNDDCTELTYFDSHNIGVAVDSKVGLLVPNIKGVENMSLLEVTGAFNGLIDKAREGRIASDDLKGGTISISNVGAIGGTTATPVINKPEAAIVALGKMQALPRFDEHDNVVKTNIMHISWSGDHRIIDGATMVRFSNLWRSYLENPVTMLSELR